MKKKCCRVSRIIVFLSVFFLMILFAGIMNVHAADNTVKRLIHVVYDDSGSMSENNKKDWCRANYSMQVFAAMLGEGDKMVVYPMSRYCDGHKVPEYSDLPTFEGGKGNLKDYIEKIKRINGGEDTPKKAVEQANKDLKSKKADDKWLVIFTDGAFEKKKDKKLEVGQFEEFRDSIIKDNKDKNVNLCLLYIGNDVDEKTKFTEDNDKNVFIYEAKNSDDILKKITEISQKVFNSNEINEIKEGKNTISFSTDVSLKEVTVFAQGKNVKIGKLNGEKSTDQVEVKYIDGEERQKPDKDLTGKIAIFKKSFKPGKYTIQVEGSKTTKIYFKPDIKLDVSVKKKNGDKVTDNYLAAGEYTLDCTLRDKGIDKPVKESKILRTVAFSAKGSNNEKKVKNNKNKEEINNGDSFKVEEGPLKIDATAKYLGNNEVSQSEKYTVVKDKKITFKFDEKKSPKYIVSSEGFKNGDKPIRMKAKIDGKPFDEKQWAKMDESEVKIEPAEKTKYKLGAFKVKKSKKDIGIFEVTPTLPGSLTGEPYKNTKVRISYDDTVGQKGSKTKWEGSSADTVKIKDDRNIFLKYRSLITKTAIGLLILILLLGWLLKKRLPKSLKSSPNIDGDPRTLRGKKSNHRGSFRKDFWSKVLPFVAEKGTIRFVPREVRGVPVMKVKAIGGNRMEIVNFRAYAEKPNVTFGGEPISPEDKKPKRIGPGTQVEVKEKDRKYTCILNS